MRIALAREGEDIITVKEYDDIQSSGEIAHFIAELEIMKQELLEIWQGWGKKE